MSEHKSHPKPGPAPLAGLFAIPCNFMSGLLTGLIAPLAAIAAMALGIRLITGRFPFLGHTPQEEGGERRLALQLVSPDEVKVLWEEHKQTFGEPISKMRLELQSIAEEAKAHE